MRLFFGKELRNPIIEAFKTIWRYYDSVFDIKETELTEYESMVGTNTYRNNTLYCITDRPFARYHDSLEISSCICGGYLGSTELQCGVLNENKFFEKATNEQEGG